MCAYKDQLGPINALEVVDNVLLAACSNGTLGAYDMQRKRIQMLSTRIHGELLSIAASQEYFYFFVISLNITYHNVHSSLVCT